MGLAFGIDLGTTYSCISYVDEFGKPIVLKNSAGDHTTPSVVYIESTNNIIVGDEAKRMVDIEPDKTVQFIKRKMGKENNTVFLNGIEYTAQEISSYILKKLVDDANTELQQTGVLKPDEKVTDVVITCPAYFGMNERDATKIAGEMAGLNVLDIINEPTAAAISYGVTGESKKETVLVYDLGGGTFDITVMHIDGGNITVICSGGDDQLGGKDWDEKLMGFIMDKFQAETGEDITEDPEAVSALYLDAETWKKSLTTREKVNISVKAMGERMRDEFTREQYEDLTRDLLNRTKNLLNDIIKTSTTAGYPLSSIDKVLLVGGSSRMPQVAKMIEQDYGIVPSLQDPDEAVAKGAAIFAKNQSMFHDFVSDVAAKTGKTVEEIVQENIVSGEIDRQFALQSGLNTAGGKLSITNVLSRTYGIRVHNFEKDKSYINNILMINDPLPAKVTKFYNTVCDNQHSVLVQIYETRSTEENIDIDDKQPLTEITMNFIAPVPIGTKIEFTMALDASGGLHIIAVEQENFSTLDTSFQLSNQMSSAQREAAEKRIINTTVE